MNNKLLNTAKDEEAQQHFRNYILMNKNENYEVALEELILASDQGYAKAQYDLGVCYNKGEGAIKDLKESVRLYKLASDQGDAGAQNNLGVCYSNGESVTENKGKQKYITN